MSYLSPRLWFEPGTDVTLPFSPSMGPVLSWQLSMVLVLVNASLSMLIHYNECIMRLKLYWKSNLPSWALLVLILVLFFPLCCFLLKLENCSVVSISLQPQGLQPTRLCCPWNSPGKNTGGRSHSLLQEIFPNQGSNPGLLHCGQILYCLSYQGSPKPGKS